MDDPDTKPEIYFDNSLSWYPAVSPDGTKIAFGHPDELVVMDRTRRVLAWWPTHGERGLLPAWSPDGTRIAFGGFNDSNFGLWIANLLDRSSVQVVKGQYTMPSWSKDGTKLAFDFRSATSSQIWVVETKKLPGELAAKRATEGYGLSEEDAGKLEDKLKTNPEDLNARTELLRYYSSSAILASGPAATIEARHRHILWLIQNHPEAAIAGSWEATIDPAGHAFADKDGYEQAKKLWLEQTSKEKVTVSVLANAAKFFQLPDKELAQEMLKRAQDMEPGNIEWSLRLGNLYALAILGVNGMDGRGIPSSVDAAELQGSFAKKAKNELENSSNAKVVGAAGASLFRNGSANWVIFAMKKITPDFDSLAEGLLKKAESLEPNNAVWPDSLVELYNSQATRSSSRESKAAFAKKELEQLEIAAKLPAEKTNEVSTQLLRSPDLSFLLPPSIKTNKLLLSVKLARASFEAGEIEKAAAYANDLLATASQRKEDPAYGMAIHNGNLVLGRVALKEGDTKRANAFLLKAGQTPGGGALTSIGPGMALAKDLLQRGERETVAEYLELCKNFWRDGRVVLDRWIQTIQSGGIPEFSANLIY